MCVCVYRCLHQNAGPFPRWLHSYLPSLLASCTYGPRINGLGFYFYEERTITCVKIYTYCSQFLLPSTHSGCRVLSCPAPSVCPYVCTSVHPAFVTTLQPTIFNGFCSYSVQPITLVAAWTLLIVGFLCLFSSIQWHFEILWMHWLTCFLE